MNPAPGVSVVVCTRDRPASLEATLDALRSCLRPGDEAAAVDSASRDPAVRRIIEASGARYIRCEIPGAARARNAGVATSSRPLVAFTDDDCLPEPNWTAVIEQSFVADERVGILTGMVRPDRPRRLHVSVMVDEEPRLFTLDDDLDLMGNGANMAFRRTAFDAVGGFDEALGPGARLGVAEDRDMFWRILRAGWRGRYEPRAVVTHEQWRDDGRSLHRAFQYGVGRGAFVSKVLRLEHARGRAMLREDLWTHGIHRAWRHARVGYESGAAADLLRTAGLVLGATRAAFVRVVDGHFRT